MGNFPFNVPALGNKFKDYRSVVMGDSYNWSWVRAMSQPRYIAIHHTAGPDTQTPEQIAAYHVQSRGWGGIGYHFLIAKDGTVYYVGDLTTARANVANYNEQVIGVCLIGNFTGGVNPTSAQIASAHELCSQMLFRTPELTNINDWNDVIGHKQLNATACPGDNWDAMRAQIINSGGVVNPPSGGSSNRLQEITNLYQTVLGRAPDSDGLNGYANSNWTIDQIRKAMVESDEHRALITRATNFKNAQNLAAEALTEVTNTYNKILQITKIGS